MVVNVEAILPKVVDILKHQKNAQINEDMLNKLYDFVLDPDIKDHERKFGLMAKADMEKGRYNVAVLQQTLISLQRESMQFGLSRDAGKLYDDFQALYDQNLPFGTNRGALGTLSSYLDS
ncbi:hypothetical protein FD51_GL002434 [Lacticaseibacillus zeae DSM 20178 = KCTC 3804]|jgi:hypothetical protein|uniref:Gar-IM n=2 Tax=Lacticaseibacillus zeae TaxID=57037 RepID=A0A0R1ETY5_LACZE|nr:hypothetical protein FD51_GL002434 [Lacticaseibacillus zeae DSM 20178 = KCTC 3804]